MGGLPRIGRSTEQDDGRWRVRVTRGRDDTVDLHFDSKELADAERRLLRQYGKILQPKYRAAPATAAPAGAWKVMSISPHETGGWRINCKENGKPKDYYAPSEEAAEARAEQLRAAYAQGGGEQVPPLPPPACLTKDAPTKDDIKDVLWWAVKAVVEHPRDPAVLKMAREASGLAQAVKSYLPEPPPKPEEDDLTGKSTAELVEFGIELLRELGYEVSIRKVEVEMDEPNDEVES